jgi:hypothetical protein
LLLRQARGDPQKLEGYVLLLAGAVCHGIALLITNRCIKK